MKVFFQAAFIIMVMATTASAKIKQLSFHELSRKADFIIEGKVMQKTARWDEKGVMIFTHYTIDVTEKISGEVPSLSNLILSIAGGTVNGKTITVTHSPILQWGQKYILFCYDNNKFSVPFVGHEQGIFKVIKDQVRKKEYIVDYNGYRIERTQAKALIRGPLTEINNSGALVTKSVAENIGAVTLPQPEVRNAGGDLITQNRSAFTLPRKREASLPITRSEFITFIKNPTSQKEGKKCRS